MQIFSGSAEQIENNKNKVKSINSARTDEEYPSAKAVFDFAKVDNTYNPQSNQPQSGKAVQEAISNFDTILKQGNDFIFDGGRPGEQIDINLVVDGTLNSQSNNAISNKAVTKKFEEHQNLINFNKNYSSNLNENVLNLNKELTQFKNLVMSTIYPLGDTWNTLSIQQDFRPYADNVSNTPKYKVFGSIVTITGAVQPKQAFQSSLTTKLIVSGIDRKYAPKQDLDFLCPGSYSAKFVLTVTTQGELYISKYGASSFETVPDYAWLPTNITYQI